MRNKRFFLLLVLLVVLTAVTSWRWIEYHRAVDLPEIDLTDAYPRVADGITAAQRSVRQNPNSGDAWGRLGMILQAHEYTEEAHECYAVAARLDADQFRWPYYLAVLSERQNPDEALRQYREAARRAPAIAVVRLRLAELLIAQGELSEAEAELREALKVKPNSGRAKLRLAQVALRKSQTEQARQWAEKAVESAHSHRLCYELLAQLYRRQGNHEAADQQLELAKSASIQAETWPDPFLEDVRQQRLDPHWIAYQAKRMIESGDVARGIELLANLVEEHPDELPFREHLAQAYIHYGDLDSAAETLDEGIRRRPKSAAMHRLRGSVWFLRNEWSAARTSYQRAIRSNPEDAAAHYDLGICLMKLGKQSDALRSLQEAVRYEPEMIEARIELAKLFRQQGKNELARVELGAAQQIAPENPLVKELLSTLDERSTPPTVKAAKE